MQLINFVIFNILFVGSQVQLNLCQTDTFEKCAIVISFYTIETFLQSLLNVDYFCSEILSTVKPVLSRHPWDTD